MIHWQKQNAAWVGALKLVDGHAGNIVLIDGRENPRGAILLVAVQGGPPEKRVLSEVLGSLAPQQVIEILCMQERAFGSGLLPPPPDA